MSVFFTLQPSAARATASRYFTGNEGGSPILELDGGCPGSC